MVWSAEKIAFRPIFVTTKSEYESESLSCTYPGGGIDCSVILEKTFVMGPYPSEKEATKAICSQLTNFRRFGGGIYAGLPLADYGGKRYDIGNIDCGPEYWKSP